MVHAKKENKILQSLYFIKMYTLTKFYSSRWADPFSVGTGSFIPGGGFLRITLHLVGLLVMRLHDMGQTQF